MERLSTLLTGWIFVLCGALLLLGLVLSPAVGHPPEQYEWPVMIALGALLLFMGVVILLRDAPNRMRVVAVAGCAIFFMCFGAFALLAPEAVISTRGPGPRTATGARLTGVALVLSGSGYLAAARSLARRGRRRGPEQPRG